ncbi:MAG: TlpA disulfide reductase family protein [Terracidiphilus sp.]|jgi:thiol-disulfide isomerase/thioredoxin
MKYFLLLPMMALATQYAAAHPQPVVVVNNIAIVHEEHGWRVQEEKPGSIHWNLMKGDLIIRIEGKNAADTGPMQMASYFNEGYRRGITAYIKRMDFGQQIVLRQIPTQDYSPVGAKPFARVARGFSAPDVELETVNNGPITIDQLKGKWVLIDFSASWCAPCVERLPAILSMAEKEKDRLAVVEIELNDKPKAVQDLIERFQIKIPVAAMNFMSPLPIQLGVSTIDYAAELPALVLIQPDGEVALIMVGSGEPEDVMKVVECNLNCKE